MLSRSDPQLVFPFRGIRIERDIAEGTNAVPEFQYTRELDSVRGVAVILVMLYHLGIFFNGFTPLVSGGFLGVDIFFVLSGFLITSVLIREQHKTGQISLRKFYWRRIYRLVPAYWLFLFILLLFGWLMLPAAQVAELYRGNKFLLAATYLTNWNSAYGVTGGNLNHTWSLSIEEQFYLLWPLALLAAYWSKLSPKKLVVMIIVLVTLLAIVRAIRLSLGASQSVLYYATESRIDSILIGCVASLIYFFGVVSLNFFRCRLFSFLTAIATITIVWIISWLDEKNPQAFQLYLTVFAICSAVVILWLVSQSRQAFRWFFLNKHLRWIGKISYGLYLWHYLAFEISRQLFDSLLVQIIFGLALAFTAATTSFYLIEQRFLLIKKRLEIA